MISGVVADRIKPVLNSIIHGDQKGFIADRYIGEAIRSTYDILSWAKERQKVGLLLLIDFEKAYDSMSFVFIEKCLHFFNFGASIISWVKLLLNNFNCVINLCGNISERFAIGRGCRQGDPIASFLFIISIEILALKMRLDPSVEGFQVEDGIEHTLEMYADDCSIFLAPKSDSLRSAIYNLNDFYNLSGLKISVSKTKAIWFGAGAQYTQKLCPDLPLIWDKEFRLLGIDFDNELLHMERNFNSKLEDIRKLLNRWYYRTMTPYGKIVIVKSLALSKLSHAALVLPSLNNSRMKDIERSISKFLWKDRPDQVNREDAKLPERCGGLGLVDVKCFWTALRFSWLRRIVKTTAFWPQLLLKTVSIIEGQDVSLTELLNFGPSKFETIGKRIKNKFWRDVFLSVKPVTEGSLDFTPEKIILAPIWDNPSITRNGRTIKKEHFPILASKITTVQDLFKPRTKSLLSKEELESRFDIEVDDNTYTELMYIVNSSMQTVGLETGRLPIQQLPSQPLLISIARATQSGCNSYYKSLRRAKDKRKVPMERANKWHRELNLRLEIRFWKKSYELAKDIKYDNKLKWMQFQIIRNSQYTNYRVSKFRQAVSPLCSYCLSENELISHLYITCPKVHQFWLEALDWLKLYSIQFPLDVQTILFGYFRENVDSKVNNLILWIKSYIWVNKFKNQTLSLDVFKSVLKNRLKDLKDIYDYLGKEENFSVWLPVYNALT